MTGVRPSAVRSFDRRPPGDRYYRHPGDVGSAGGVGRRRCSSAHRHRGGDLDGGGITDRSRARRRRVPVAVRELLLALAQVAAVVRAGRRGDRARRPAAMAPVGAGGGGRRRRRRALRHRSTSASTSPAASLTPSTAGPGWPRPDFPSLPFIAGPPPRRDGGQAVAVSPVAARHRPGGGRPGDARSPSLAPPGVPELLLAAAPGPRSGRRSWPSFGAPNRRPAPGRRGGALQAAGLDVVDLTLQRAEGGRSQLYTVDVAAASGLREGVRAATAGTPTSCTAATACCCCADRTTRWPSAVAASRRRAPGLPAPAGGQGGVTCPRVELVTRLADGSMALALEHVAGARLDELRARGHRRRLLDAVWRRSRPSTVAVSPTGRCGPRTCSCRRPARDHRLRASARSRRRRGCRRSTAPSCSPRSRFVGPEPAVASAASRPRPGRRGARLAVPAAAGPVGRDPQAGVEVAAARAAGRSSSGDRQEPVAARAPRPRPPSHAAHDHRARRRVLRAAPAARQRRRQLQALRSRVLGVARRLPRDVRPDLRRQPRSARRAACRAAAVRPDLEAQMASSFVNRVTPANVGGMALNVRFMQKAGVDPPKQSRASGSTRSSARSCTSCCSSRSSRGPGRTAAPLQHPRRAASARRHRRRARRRGAVRRHPRGRRLVRTHVARVPQPIVDAA